MASNNVYFEGVETALYTRTQKRRRSSPSNQFLEFQYELEAIPVYFVSAHSCLCAFDNPCYGEKRNLTFEIPKDTYIMSFSQVNDAFRGTLSTDRAVITNSRSLRQYLYMHDTSDLLDNPEVGSTKFSLFSGVQRATSTAEEITEYPNVAYTFNHEKEDEPEKNFSGVYAIDGISSYKGMETLNNSKSVVPQELTRKNYFLEDIIQEVYEKTGIQKGIFVCTGCLPICSSSSLKPKNVEATLDKIATIMHIANNRYKTLKPTWTRDEMLQMGKESFIPTDIAIKFPSTGMDPSEVVDMHAAGLLEGDYILNEMPQLIVDEEDRETVRKKLRTLEVLSGSTPVDRHS